MNIIPVSESFCIIDPYYDGGESYKEHCKYSCLQEYDILQEASPVFSRPCSDQDQTEVRIRRRDRERRKWQLPPSSIEERQ